MVHLLEHRDTCRVNGAPTGIGAPAMSRLTEDTLCQVPAGAEGGCGMWVQAGKQTAKDTSWRGGEAGGQQEAEPHVSWVSKSPCVLHCPIRQIKKLLRILRWQLQIINIQAEETPLKYRGLCNHTGHMPMKGPAWWLCWQSQTCQTPSAPCAVLKPSVSFGHQGFPLSSWVLGS